MSSSIDVAADFITAYINDARIEKDMPDLLPASFDPEELCYFVDLQGINFSSQTGDGEADTGLKTRVDKLLDPSSIENPILFNKYDERRRDNSDMSIFLFVYNRFHFFFCNDEQYLFIKTLSRFLV